MLLTFQPIADAQDLGFSVDLDDRLPATIATDPLRLRQVLKNLLSNAFKFTEHGEVALRLELCRDGWSPGHDRLARAPSVIALSVRDTGIGITSELHATVFEAFAQADGSTARKYGGTGLGLSISRNLVDLLGGEIVLASEAGQGSTFTVYLPLEALAHQTGNGAAPSPAAVLSAHVRRVRDDSDGRAGPAAASVSPLLVQAPRDPALGQPHEVAGHEGFYRGAAAGLTVLIVDDDFRNIFALTALLERLALSVIAAEGGVDALAILDERTDIDLVLMDIMMPGMNGYETMEAIRERPALAELPVLAVTGKVVHGERARCLAAGASDYIPKPVDTAELLDALRDWLPAPARAQP
jgi:CheY-like chemotaxis protein